MHKCSMLYGQAQPLDTSNKSSPEEDKIPLVVKGDHPPPPELRILVEQAAQHTADSPPQTSVEVIQQELRPVVTDAAMPLRAAASRSTTTVVEACVCLCVCVYVWACQLHATDVTIKPLYISGTSLGFSMHATVEQNCSKS